VVWKCCLVHVNDLVVCIVDRSVDVSATVQCVMASLTVLMLPMNSAALVCPVVVVVGVGVGEGVVIVHCVSKKFPLFFVHIFAKY